MTDPHWKALAAAGLAVIAAAPVRAVIAAEYLSIEQAQKALFPQADRFNEVMLALSPEQRRKVAALAGPQPPHRSIRIWKATRGGMLVGHVFVDEVVGRQEFITYAAGIDAAGKLGPLEVLAYRESHGGEIRNPAWRRQFAGRQGLQSLGFGTDIKNISGATLSCQHVTEGVRWLVAIREIALERAGT